MSEFRIFCSGGMVGLVVTTVLNGVSSLTGSQAVTMNVWGLLVFGCAAVAFFGKRP